MSSAYDIDAINRMLGLDSDGDVTTDERVAIDRAAGKLMSMVC